MISHLILAGDTGVPMWKFAALPSLILNMLASLQTAARNAALLHRPTLYTSSRCIATSLRLCNDQPTQDEPAKQDDAAALDGPPSAEADAEATPTEEPAAPIKESRRRRRFHEWANGAGKKYARAADGTTNYLNGETPFPNNPLFRPRPPISDAQRQKLYDTYLSDPEAWTIRKLATKFNISIRRTEAIIRLKENERQMEENVCHASCLYNKP